MKKLSELKSYLKNIVIRILDNYVDIKPIGNPNFLLRRIQAEANILNMKVDLYTQCFSTISKVFHYPIITGMRGYHPIPKEIKRIVLYPMDFVFLENIYICETKFMQNNKPYRIQRYIDVNQNANYVVYNFSFGNTLERKLLVKKINFEINKLFVLDNAERLDLRPYLTIRPDEDVNYYHCIQCYKFLHINDMNHNDFLVCSINCGMKLRGLSIRDFV